jgi:hypothetical protein
LNGKDTEAWTGRFIAKATLGVILRVLGVLFWFLVYIGFMYSGGYGNALAGIVGVMALIVGAIALLSPKRALGEKRWFYAIYVFYGLGFLLPILSRL